MSEILDIQGVAKLAQDIFPEVSGSAWSMSVASSGEHFVVGAVFDRRMRMEVILQHGEWAVCRIFVKLEDAARTENEVERTVIKPTEDNFIGWFSSVRSQCPLPQDFVFLHRNGDANLFRHDPDPQNDLAGHLLHVSVDYKKVTFKARLRPQFKTTPEQIRYLMAKGCIVPWGARVSPCEGCAKPHCSKRDRVNDPDCFVVEAPQKPPEPDLWDEPSEATGNRRKVPCDRCRSGLQIVASTGDWDWSCSKGNHPQRDCDDFEPEAAKSGPGPKPSCPQCAHFDARTHGCHRDWVVGSADSCADFKWAGIAPGGGTGLRATRPSERNCKNCENYGGPGTCKVDEALGTAPICNLYSQKAPPKVWPKCTTCRHLKDDGDCHINVSMTGYEDCDFYEDKPAEGSTRESVQCLKCAHGVKSKSKAGDWSVRCQRGENPRAEARCPLFDSMFVNRRI